MKKLFILIFLVSTGLSSFKTYAQDYWNPEKIQAGFYTPQRVGQLWDTWLYYYNGLYYQYYLAGVPGKWDSFELMTSKDGVNWKEVGRISNHVREQHGWEPGILLNLPILRIIRNG